MPSVVRYSAVGLKPIVGKSDQVVFEASSEYLNQVPVGSAVGKTTGSIGMSFGWVSRGPSVALVVLSDAVGAGGSDQFGTLFFYSALAGPRLRLLPRHRVQPFAQLLLGVKWAVGGSSSPSSIYPHVSSRAAAEFQVAPSVGLDVRVGRSVTLRVAQVEYRSFMGGNTADRFSVSSGVVLGFGHRKR